MVLAWVWGLGFGAWVLGLVFFCMETETETETVGATRRKSILIFYDVVAVLGNVKMSI